MARILMPSEYGVVGIRHPLSSVLSIAIDFGAGTVFASINPAECRDIDSAWTLRALQGIAVGLLLILLSPAASLYFPEPRVAPVVRRLAPGMRKCFTNIGLILAQRISIFYRFQVSITAAVVHYWRGHRCGLATG